MDTQTLTWLLRQVFCVRITPRIRLRFCMVICMSKCCRVSRLADPVMAERICMRSSQGETLPTWHQQMWCSTVEVHDVCVHNCVYLDCRCCAVSATHGGRAEQGSELPWLGYPPAQLLVLLWLFCGVLCQAARLHLLLQVTPYTLLALRP